METPSSRRHVTVNFSRRYALCRRRHGRARVRGRLCVDKSVKEETRILWCVSSRGDAKTLVCFMLLAFDTGSNGPGRVPGHLCPGQIHRGRRVLRLFLLREVRPCCCASIGLREGRSSNGVRHLVFALFAATAPLSRSECCGRRWRRLVSSAAAQRTTASAVRQRFAAGERLPTAKPRARHAASFATRPGWLKRSPLASSCCSNT